MIHIYNVPVLCAVRVHVKDTHIGDTQKHTRIHDSACFRFLYELDRFNE